MFKLFQEIIVQLYANLFHLDQSLLDNKYLVLTVCPLSMYVPLCTLKLQSAISKCLLMFLKISHFITILECV